MEAEAQEQKRRQVLKFGDTICLNCIDFHGFISADTKQRPQARLEELIDGVDVCPDLKTCRFQIRQRYQYSSKKAYTQELERMGHGSDMVESLTSFSPANLSFTWFDGLRDSEGLYRPVKKRTLATRRPGKSAAKRLQDLRKASMKEQRGNDDEFGRLVGEPVLYGQVVQLYHVSTGKYLTIKRTAADVERGALKVILFDGGTQGSWFHIVSGYGTKMEGSKCLFADLVALESTTFNGMGLHASVVPITEEGMLPVKQCKYVKNSWELTASPDLGVWKIIPHCLHPSLLPPRALNGYSAVTLVHKTSNNLLMYDQGKVFFASTDSAGATTGNAIFQIEPVEVEWCGMAVEFDVWVRFKNVVTNLYLTLGRGDCEEGQMEMTENYNHPGSMWKLRAFSKGVDRALMDESFAYILNENGCWLSQGDLINQGQHASAHPQGGPVIYNETQDGYSVMLREQCLERNVIAVHKIDSEYVQKLASIRRCLEIVDSYARELEGVDLSGVTIDSPLQEIKECANRSGLQKLFNTKFHSVEKTLEEMVSFVDPENYEDEELAERRTYQVLSRETRLMDRVVDCLRAIDFSVFFEAGKESKVGSVVLKFGTSCHRFLQFACSGNHRNQLYLSAFLDTIKSHLGGALKAADTLVAIFEDNMDQIQQVTEDIIIAFVELIRKYGYRPRFINFLRTICGTQDRPVPKNQNWLLRHLFQDPMALFFGGSRKKCDFGTVKEGETWVLSIKHPNEGLNETYDINCHDFWRYPDDVNRTSILGWNRKEEFLNANPENGLFIYYVISFKLFCALCYGRNIEAHSVLHDPALQEKLGMQFSSLHFVVENAMLPYTLRCAALELIISLFVDVDPYHPIIVPKMTRLLEDSLNLDANGAGDSGPQIRHRRLAANSGTGKDLIRSMAGRLISLIASAAQSGPAETSFPLVHEGQWGAKSVQKPAEKVEEGAQVDVGHPGENWDCTGGHAFILRLIEAVGHLLRLGILDFSSEQARTLLPSLLELMRQLGSSEGTELYHGAGAVVTHAKHAILNLFDSALDAQTEVLTGKVFKEFSQCSFGGLEGIQDEVSSASADLDLDDLGPSSSSRNPLRGGGSNNKIAPQTEVSKPDLESITNRLVKAINADITHGFQLLKLDPISYGKMEGPVTDILGLLAHNDSKLNARTFQLVERLLSKRRKLMYVLMNTHMLIDEESALLYRYCECLHRELKSFYRLVGSRDSAKRLEAVSICKANVEELTKVLTPHSRVRVPTGGHDEREMYITKGKATKFQSVLCDLSVHETILTFLKLPLRRQAQFREDGSQKMDGAQEIPRRELFGLCYLFLRNFCVISTTTYTVSNWGNQSIVFADLDLFMSHTGVEHLNVADTISALFVRNADLAREIGLEIIRKFVKLIVKFGDKKRARWLRFLQSIVVVDKKPIKDNQAAVLKLAAQYEAEFCSFFNKGENEKLERLRLLEEDDHVKNVEEGADAHGSKLSYNKECVELLAHCCGGKNTTSIVKASDFLSFSHVVDMLLLYGMKRVKLSTYRFLATAYWNFMGTVYFSTDTQSTRIQVRSPNNSIWPPEIQNTSSMPLLESVSSEDQIMAWEDAQYVEGHYRSLIETVLQELEEAKNEPKDALLNRYSATAFLPECVFPALKHYFVNHYLQHVARLPTSHDHMLLDLTARVTEYIGTLSALNAGGFGVKQEKKVALESSYSLLEAISEATGVMGMELHKAEKDDESPSLASGKSSISMRVISKNWEAFYQTLGNKLGVRIKPDTHEALEERTICGQNVEYASLFLMVHIFTQPWGQTIPRSNPVVYFENVPERLSELFAENLHRTRWSDDLSVRMIRALRGALHIDDGQCNPASWKRSWKNLLQNEALTRPKGQGPLMTWAQCKYNSLGATRAAVKLIGHPKLCIQLEAIRLLITLLEGGCKEVQDTLYDILSKGGRDSTLFFANMKAAFQKCMLYARANATKRCRKGASADGKNKGNQNMDESVESEEDDDDVWEDNDVVCNDADNAFAFTMDALRCLQLMAEGHHTNNQCLLNHQPNNSINHDMIVEAVNLLTSLQNSILESLGAGNRENPTLMIRIFEFLQELVQGPCRTNQAAMVLRTTFLLTCNRIFGYVDYDMQGRETEEGAMQKAEIKFHLLYLLYNCLEGVTEREIPSRMMDVIDMNAMQNQVLELFGLLGLNDDPPVFNSKAVKCKLKRELLQYFFFLEKLDACLTGVSHSQHEGTAALFHGRDAYDGNDKVAHFIDENLGGVEVLWNGRIEKAYFELKPVCQRLACSRVWKKGALEALRSISPDSRSNPVLKGIELVKVMERLVHDIQIEARYFSGKAAWLMPIVKQRRAIQESTAYIAIGILLLLCITYDMDNQEWWKSNWGWTMHITFVLCVMEMMLTALVAVIHFFHDLKKWAEDRRKDKESESPLQLGKLKSTFKASFIRGGSGEAKADQSEEEGLLHDKVSVEAGGVPRPPPIPSKKAKRLRHAETLFKSLTYWKTWYILLLLIATVGAVAHSPFYITCHLTFFFVEFEAGQMMVYAFSKSGMAILRTAALALLSIVIFAVITFSAFKSPLSDTDLEPCNTFFQCIGSHMIAGIYGDIGTLFTDNENLAGDVPEKLNEAWRRQLRSLFVVLFFMLWTFVLSNIFTGLIADAFGAIRDDKNTVQTDSDSKCLVCSLDRFTLDRAGNGFQHHIEKEHNPLAYVFYLYYLKSTPPDLYTGYDSAVVETLASRENQKANWLPIGRAFVLENLGDLEKEERQKILGKLDHLWQFLKVMDERLRDLEILGKD